MRVQIVRVGRDDIGAVLSQFVADLLECLARPLAIANRALYFSFSLLCLFSFFQLWSAGLSLSLFSSAPLFFTAKTYQF